jgi:nitroreductase
VETFADLIRSRRTHKSFGPDPVPPETLDELLELARWAPNHHRTNPWRFRVLGPETLARLQEAAGPGEAPKLERAPTLVLASCVLSGDLQQDEEDVCATACAIYTACSRHTHAGSPATGARLACCARKAAATRSGCPTASASSA